MKQPHLPIDCLLKEGDIEALKEALNAPSNFFDFSPIEDAPDFKSLRNDLKNNIPDETELFLMFVH